MKSSKAIEILGAQPDPDEIYSDPDTADAILMGKEALKEIRNLRIRFPTLMPDLLPGEDPDDS